MALLCSMQCVQYAVWSVQSGKQRLWQSAACIMPCKKHPKSIQTFSKRNKETDQSDPIKQLKQGTIKCNIRKMEPLSNCIMPRSKFGGSCKKQSDWTEDEQAGMESLPLCFQNKKNPNSCAREWACNKCNTSWLLQTVWGNTLWRNRLQKMTSWLLQKLRRRSIN